MIPAISLKNVTRVFSARFALRRTNFDIAEGEAVAVTGPNGSGKTTLLRLMSTLLRPSSGELRIFGKDPSGDGKAVRERIGALFVETFLYNDLTVRENLRFYGRMYRLGQVDATITAWLERLNLLEVQDEHVRNLSKGERQRVALVRSLLHGPSIMLWDEPTGGLDEAGRNLFRAIALEHKGKQTIVCATHDLSSIRGWVDREIRLENGRVQ